MSSRSILHDQRLNHTTHVNNISVLQKVQEKTTRTKKQEQKNNCHIATQFKILSQPTAVCFYAQYHNFITRHCLYNLSFEHI